MPKIICWDTTGRVDQPLPGGIAAIDEGENAEEQAERGKEQDQDAVAKGGAALLAGSGRVLVTHRTALGGGVRSEKRKEHSTARTHEQAAENASLPREPPSDSSILVSDSDHDCAPANSSINKKTQSAFMECQ